VRQDRLGAARGWLVRRSLERLAERAWFASLPPDVRSWVGVVVEGGIDGFGRWLADPSGEPAEPGTAFAAVPESVSRAVTLEQTVEMVRTVVQVVEAAVPELAEPAQEAALRSEVERYGREVAFAVARVYARAAEQRGAWDARLQALVVDALLAGDDGRIVTSRASALGWPVADPVRVAALRPPDGDTDAAVVSVLRLARHARTPVLAALHGTAVVAVLREDDRTIRAAGDLLPDAAVVVGPPAPGVAEAAASARAALAGLAVLPAWTGPPGPVEARALLPERALAGDPLARAALLEEIYQPLVSSGPDLVATLEALAAAGGSLEAAARALPVHVNTLRYRLKRVEDLCGVDPRSPRGSLTLRLAMILGRLPASL